MVAYYNENEPKAAAWLRELINVGHLPAGEVDDRSIEEVTGTDLAGFGQCHFFAGIGGWPYALNLAGWPRNRAVWTGSCPCQPFSEAGSKGGTADKRHLWPHFFRLIRECRPATVFGEQVASKAGLAWLDIVSADLESADYAIGAADLCAAGIEAPHIRQRLWFVAHANGSDAGAERQQHGGELRLQSQDGGALRLADVASNGRSEECSLAGRESAGDRAQGRPAGPESGGESCGVEYAQGEQAGLPRRSWEPRSAAWADCDWIECTDGKWRPVETGTFPLAHGIPARMGRLRGYGNAIVPQVAAEFIRAYNREGDYT